MEPVKRVTGVRSGTEPVTPSRPLDRVEREDPRPDEDAGGQGRRQRPKAPRDGVRRGPDGQLHVDVQA